MTQYKPMGLLMRALCLVFGLAMLVLAAGALAGCATATMDNVPACELATTQRKGYVNSMLGTVGLSFRLTDRSAAVMCPDLPPAATAAPAPAPAPTPPKDQKP